MPRVRDLLYRFRPAAAPGSATAAGVPADRARELADELEPVFAALADTEGECADIVESARHEADRIVTEAGVEAEAVRSEGRARVASERAAAAAAIRDTRSSEISAASDAVGRSIALLQEHSDRLLPVYVAAGVDSLRALTGVGGRSS